MERQLKTSKPIEEEQEELWVTILFTTAKRTRSALTAALEWTRNLHASLRIIVVRVVPYPLPLESPPVPVAFARTQILELTKNVGVETTVQVYDCRDSETTLLQLLPTRSVVILGSRRSFWPTVEKRLARRLKRAGHDVILTETE